MVDLLFKRKVLAYLQDPVQGKMKIADKILEQRSATGV